MAFNPFSIGNPFPPVVNDKELRMIILHQGMEFIHKRKDTKCPDGWDSVSGTHDPECNSCTSNSGYIYTDRLLKAAYMQRDAHAMYNVENVTTVAGSNERVDAEIYTEFHPGRMVQQDDIIILERKYGLKNIEFTVMTKKELRGTKGRVAGYRILLFKSPMVDTISPVTHKRL